jgi:hypothetical protein
MAESSLNVERIEQPAEEADIGVLFIHGIGSQKRGQTLTEFAEPIIDWLKDRFRGLDQQWREVIAADPQQSTLERWRTEVEHWANDKFPRENRIKREPNLLAPFTEKLGCDTVVGRVRPINTRITDPKDLDAPAHTTLLFQRQRIEGNVETERWLLAESWWAETFLPPGFMELASWGLHIIPWAIGSHFGAQVQRVLAQRSGANAQTSWWKKTLGGVDRLWRVLAAFVGLIVGLLVSVPLLALLAILLLAVLLPIPLLKEALLKLQLKIASTLGDSYMLVSREISQNSIVERVRSDGRWLARRCKVVAVVAHSQGAAVAHKALQEDISQNIPQKLRLLFTFGSGLKKLEQLEHSRSERTYLLSANATLIALLVFVLFLASFVLGVMKHPFAPSPTASVIMMFVALVFLVAGILDDIREINLPHLQRWIQQLKKTPVEWVDCFATADPVSNGLLFDEPAVKELSKEVSNLSSILRDHTSYWANRDQFVTLLIQQLTQPKLRKEAALPPAPELAEGQQSLDWIGRRRRWRLGILSAIGRVATLSVLLAIYREFQFWWSILLYSSFKILAWMSGHITGKSESAIGLTVSWPTLIPALILLALVLITYGITRWRWQVWNDVEMRALIEGSISAVKDPLVLLVGLEVQLLIAGGLLYREIPTFFFIMVLGGVPLTVGLTQPRPSTPRKGKPLEEDAPPGEPLSWSEQLWMFLWQLTPMPLVGFGLGSATWDGVVWLGKRCFGGSILGFRPSEVPREAVGLVVAAVVVAFVIGRRAWGRVRIARDR